VAQWAGSMTTWRQSKDFDLVLSSRCARCDVVASPSRCLECGQIFASSLRRKRALPFSTRACLFLDRMRDSRAIGSAKSVRCHPTRHSSGASSPTRGRFTASREEKNGTIRARWNQAVSRPPQIAGARVRFAAGPGKRATASPEIFFGGRASSDSSLLFLLNVKAVAALLSTSSLGRPQPYSLHSLVNAVRGVPEYQGR
jgi:hypothetical protein